MMDTDQHQTTASGGIPCPLRPAMEQLLSALEQAGTWEDLGWLCSQADALYQEGGLSLDQVETLAFKAAHRARAIPAETSPTRDIPASDLLPSRPGACPTCGGVSRWYNHGVPICAVCHPHPGVARVTMRTAA